jgi:hypothetical protein
MSRGRSLPKLRLNLFQRFTGSLLAEFGRRLAPRLESTLIDQLQPIRLV